MIAVLDYGTGNLRSAERALLTTGAEVVVTSEFEVALEANGLVVPGVGAFGSCMAGLERVRGIELIRRRFELERATLGICVGMQVLFSGSAESPGVSGVSLFDGEISQLQAPVIPHMGWNQVSAHPGSTLFRDIEEERFYFVHSYAMRSTSGIDSALCSTSRYGTTFVSAIEYRTVMATQFHPEKSGSAGLRLLRNWVDSLE